MNRNTTMTVSEALREAEARIGEHLRAARAAVSRAEAIARYAGFDWAKPKDLAALEQVISRQPISSLFEGITVRKTTAPRELFWALSDDMTWRERWLGRSGRLRHWRARRRERARLRRGMIGGLR